MGHKTKVQCINRKASRQLYVNFPAAVAEVVDLKAGEVVEWQLLDRTQMLLNRTEAPAPPAIKKKRME